MSVDFGVKIVPTGLPAYMRPTIIGMVLCTSTFLLFLVGMFVES